MPRRGSPGEASLCALIEGEVIPRLLRSHPAGCPGPAAGGEAVITAEEVEQFAALPLSLEADDLLAEIETYLDRGVSAEAIFVELLAPSARRLGQYWEEDVCDFVEVTMGLWRLQEVLRSMAMASPAAMAWLEAPRSALFATLPGDRHSFGVCMIGEVFARKGWDVEVMIDPARGDLIGSVADRAIDLLGLTLSLDCPSARLADLISSLRGVSRNPRLVVILGGSMVDRDPGLVARVGADGTAADARSALALAENLVMEAKPFATY